MAKYLFELGRIPDISIAELNSLLGEENLVGTVEHFALYEIKKTILNSRTAQSFQDRLGGTIRSAEIVAEFPLKGQKLEELKSKIETSLEEVLTDHFKDRSGKIPFALTAINIPDNPKVFLKFFLNFSKKILKSLGFNSRFVNKPWSNPTSAQIYKSGSVSKGIDLIIIGGNDILYIAKTVSIQNIDKYSYRDYEKPFRDARMGMLPPKLAQIMINLAEPSPSRTNQIIFDPFCGSGTILMEAMLQGKDAIGSDIDKKAVEGTTENLYWLTRKFENTPKEFVIFQKDAQEIIEKDFPLMPDAIVTETHLGPPVSRIPTEENLRKTFENLTSLHLNWLSGIAKIIPPKTRIVLCLPAFKKAKSSYIYFPDFESIAKETGFRVINRSDSATKKPLIYDRPDQIVAREIVVLEKFS